MLRLKIENTCIEIRTREPKELFESLNSDFSRRYLPPLSIGDCSNIAAVIYWISGEEFTVLSASYSSNAPDIYVVSGDYPRAYENESPVFFLTQVLARSLANMWRQIGIYAEVKAMDTGSMSAIIWQNKDGKTILGHDIDLWDWNVGPDDVTIFDVFVTGRKLTGTSDSGYSNPEYDELYEKLFEAKTFNELLSIAYKLQEILYNDLPYISLCEVEPIQAHNTKFTGFNYDWPGGPFGGNDWTTFLNVRLTETSSTTPQQVESTLQAPVAQTSDQTMMLALIAVVVATVAVVAGYLFVTRRR